MLLGEASVALIGLFRLVALLVTMSLDLLVHVCYLVDTNEKGYVVAQFLFGLLALLNPLHAHNTLLSQLVKD